MYSRFQDRHYVPLDVHTSKSWVIMHSALVHTYVHQDAEGSNTWTRVMSGEKIWVFNQPPPLVGSKNRKEYWDSLAQYLKCATTLEHSAGTYHPSSRCFFVRASAGDIVCVLRDQ